jgi:hypothetical protein
MYVRFLPEAEYMQPYYGSAKTSKVGISDLALKPEAVTVQCTLSNPSPLSRGDIQLLGETIILSSNSTSNIVPARLSSPVIKTPSGLGVQSPEGCWWATMTRPENYLMSTTDLKRLLASIGMSTFVQYYDQFRDSNISDQDMLERLPQDYTLKARRTRVSKARRIFRERLELEALNAILGANRVDEETRKKATEILNR